MNKAIALLGLLLAVPAFAQVSARPSILSRSGGGFVASAYDWETRTSSAVTAAAGQTVTIYVGAVALKDGRVIYPFATTVPIKIDSGANQEVVTPTAVSGCSSPNTTSTCTVTATFTLAHAAGALIQSGTFGLQDAIQDAILAGGGTVYVDSFWGTRGGTNAMITAMTLTATTAVQDLRAQHMVTYTGVAKTTATIY